jgi:hypothetical protein
VPSITSPAIIATGSNIGIGIKNNSGKFNYYDGIITANTTPLPEAPTKIEYLYEPNEFTNADNNKYVILKWMREQASTPGN